MKILTEKINHWPLYKQSVNLLRFLATMIILLVSLFVAFSITVLVAWILPIKNIWLLSSIFFSSLGFISGFVVSALFFLERSRGNEMYELILGDSNVEKGETKTIIFHFISYFTIGGLLLGGFSLIAKIISNYFGNRVNSEMVVTQSEIDISIAVLKMAALFLPVWVTFISIGIKMDMEKDNNNYGEGKHTVVPHQFTSIAMFGYFGILGIIIAAVWVLLPTLPQIMANSLLILIVVLSVVGIGIYYVDKSLVDKFTDGGNEAVSVQGANRPRIKTKKNKKK